MAFYSYQQFQICVHHQKKSGQELIFSRILDVGVYAESQSTAALLTCLVLSLISIQTYKFNSDTTHNGLGFTTLITN